MKFLCVDCDRVMDFAERQLPGDGTMAAVFACPSCGREVAMLTNPAETRMVSSLGVRVGGREVPEQPMELVRGNLASGRDGAFGDGGDPAVDAAPLAGEGRREKPASEGRLTVGSIAWDDAARERLGNVPGFVRGMVKRIYAEWAVERGIRVMTPELMDRAREELGMEGM